VADPGSPLSNLNKCMKVGVVISLATCGKQYYSARVAIIDKNIIAISVFISLI